MTCSIPVVSATQITPDGRTHTTVNQSGTSYDVATTTISQNGRTAFNSFHDFSVDASDTVKMHLPEGTGSLVNLVWDSRATINGTLKSLLSDGSTGGAVYFADPHGVVIGNGAEVDVGALSLSAPTQDFMNSLLGPNGSLATDTDQGSLLMLMQGAEPQAPAPADGSCLICVAGRVNANNAVRVRATAIDVSGTIFVSGNGGDTLSTAVNLEDQADPVIVTDGNTIRLIADAADSTGIGDASADAAIHVGGRLHTAGTGAPGNADPSSWGLVQVDAHAVAQAAFTTQEAGGDTTTLATQQVQDLFKDQDDLFENGLKDAATDANVAAADRLGQAAFVRASATATVDITGAIEAGGDVMLSAATATEASTEATATADKKAAPVMVGAMYGAVYSKAKVNVADSASVVAGGALAVNTSTDNTLDISVDTEVGDRPVATTVAWSQAAVEASSVVAGHVQGQSLAITAHNANSFSTAASTGARASGGSVGIAGAVSLQTVRAEAQLGGTPEIIAGGSGNVTVAAGNDTAANTTTALTSDLSAEDSEDSDDKTDTANADLTGTLANKSNTGLNADSSQDHDALPFHVGGAVAYTDASHTASASIADGVTLVTPGDVAVYSEVTDAGVHNGASSRTVSVTGGNGEDGAQKVTIAAAVAYAQYQHDSSATVGANADITAAHIGVGSDVSMPFDGSFGQSDSADAFTHMFDSLDDFMAGAAALKDMGGARDAIIGGVTGYAGATAGGQSSAAIGGSVNYLAVTQSNHAWIGNGAHLTSTADASAMPGDDGWSSTIDWSDAAIDWDHSIAVAAHTDATVFDLVGDLMLGLDGTAVGGAFNYTGYRNDNVAGIGSGAVLTSANDVGVGAVSNDRLIALSPVSGKGGSTGMQGTVAITDLDDATHASVSAAADVVAHALRVQADDPLMVWSLAGALGMSDQASVGIAVGINQTHTDTVASIGDNSADDATAASGTAPAQTGGTVQVAALSVLAATRGESGALSVAGTSTGSSSNGDDDGGDDSGSDGARSTKLLQMVGKAKTITGHLQDALEKVDGMAGVLGDDGSLLDDAGDALDQIAGGLDGAGKGLQGLTGKAGEEGSEHQGTQPDSTTRNKGGSFGIGVSGAAAVNLAQLGARAELDGAHVVGTGDDASVTVRATDEASLASFAGAAALQRAKTSGFSGALAGAVAYSSVADATTARIHASRLDAAPQVTVQALDGSQQIGVAIGMGVNSSGSTAVTVAGSVSLATSHNTTLAAIDGGSVLDGGGSDGSQLDVTAYDHSRIGVGGGSLYAGTGGSAGANVGIGFTYADIRNRTQADLSGHNGTAGGDDIAGYDSLALRALDSSLIGAGALAGGYAGSQDSLSLAGAIVWTNIANTTQAGIDQGMQLRVGSDALVQASAVAPVDALDALLDTPDAVGYDFAGAQLGSSDALTGGQTAGSAGDPDQPTLSLDTGGLGSSIIAVAGTLQAGGNNVGLSYVGNNVHNTHSVRIDDATLNVGGTLSLAARDDTRIIGVAAGLGVSSGQFAGLGSATSNIVGNTDSILIGSAATPGHGATLHAGAVEALASDDTTIYALAGNVAIGKGSLAAGGALTYNAIGNDVSTHAGNTLFDVGGAVGLHAEESATILGGAVAAAANGRGTALTLSLGWNQTANDVRAVLDDGSLLRAGALDLTATNKANIYTLSGDLSIGGSAAAGLAVSIGDIGDTTTASMENVGLDVATTDDADGAVRVAADGTGTLYSLAVAGAAGSSGAGVAGSATANTLDSDVTARASHIYGVADDLAAATDAAAKSDSLLVQANSTGGIYTLAGGIAFGSSAGVGAAVAVADVGGSTSAHLGDAVLDVGGDTTVAAGSSTTIDSASVAGAAAGSVAVSASNTTNLVHNGISADMVNVGTTDSIDDTSQHNVTRVQASDDTTINALAGAVGGAGSAAVGAATSVNRIATTTSAAFDGGSDDEGNDHRLYKTGSLLVSAGAGNPNAGGEGNAANINTIAVGAAGGGSAAVAGSVAVNILGGSTSARIGRGAHVVANDNLGVLAGNDQGIDVFAGQASLGGSVGVGLGVVVNDIDGSTVATIADSDVTAFGLGDALDVDGGNAVHADALDGSIDVTGSDDLATSIADPKNYARPDLAGAVTEVHGIAVNASNQQHIATLGVGASVGGAAAVGALAGVNVVGGTTSASIEDSQINQTALPTPPPENSSSENDDTGNATGTGDGQDEDTGTVSGEAAVQQVDVRAGSRQYEANFVVNLAGSGSAGAAVSAAANVFDATTSARISGSTVASQAGTAIDATGQQWSLAMAAGMAASGEVAAAGSGAVTVMQANTSATLDGGSLDVGSLDVTADSHAASSQVAGAVGIGVGAVGVAGAATVNVDNTTTTASIRNGANVLAGNAVNVDATSSNVAKALVISGAVGAGAGMAGGALVNVAENHTQAFVQNSHVDAGEIGITALDRQIIHANSGTLGGGFIGAGGAINVSLLQSSVGAGAVDSTLITHGGDIAVTADAQRDVQSKALAFGGGVVGAGLSASVIVAGTGNLGDNAGDLHANGQINLDQLDALGSQDRLDGDNASYGLDDDQLGDGELTALNDHARYSLADATEGANGSFGNSDGVRAQVSGGSLSSAGQVIVKADVSSATDNVAGGVAVGAAAIGGSLAYTSLSTDVHAGIDSAAVTAAKGIDVSAASGNLDGRTAASSQAYAGVGGLVGVGAAVAVSHVDNTVSASAGGNLQAKNAGTGALTINASDSSSAVAGNGNLRDISNISLGGIVAGAVVVDAQRSSSVSALLDDQTVASGFADVDVGASDSGEVQAHGVMGAGGVLTAVSAVVASASDNSAVVAGIGRGARVSAATTSVHASADPTASAEAKGITVGGIGGGIGANVALASVGASVDAYVDDGAMFDTGNLSVAASASPQVSASSSGGAGAVLLGVNASVADASDTVAVHARVGNAVKLPSGSVSISAATHTQQSATALGVSGGIVAMGAATAAATSHATTTASLGDGDGSTAATAGTLAVIASGTDVNEAHSKAGSGGLVAGTAAEADTASSSSANASIGAHQQLKHLANLQLSAIENISYGGTADSVQAAAVGGSGAFVDNRIDSSTDARIGDGTTIVAGGSIDVLAQTRLGNTLHNDGATGGSGGILTGTAAKVQTRIDARNTAAVGADATITSGQAPSASHVGHTTILAGTVAGALYDTATISAGGAVPAANAVVDIDDNFVNQVQLGDRGTYLSFGRTDIGTYTSLQQVSALATSDTYGLAPIGASAAKVSLNSTQAVDIGDDVGITGYDEVDIVAGKDILNARETRLAASAFAQSYVRGVASIPVADAAVTTASTSDLALGAGSLVVSGGDIAIGAQQGTHPINVDGTGYGYQLGFIPSTTHSSTQGSTDTATTTLDGNVIAGAFNTINLSIDADGKLHDVGSTAPYLATLKTDFNPTEYLNALDGVDGRTYSGMDNAEVGGYIFDSLLVGGGDAYLYGSTIGGSGAVTANGSPSVNILNNSAYYLVLPDIEVGFGSAGHVRVSGGADAAHLGGLTVTQPADSGVPPTVTITSTHAQTATGTAPGIVLGSVTNLSGTVTIKNDYGSLLQRGSVSANTQTVDVPGGYVTIDLGNGNWYSGADPASDLDSSWIGQFLDGVIGSPDYAAAAIALSVYPGVADDPRIPGPDPDHPTPSNYEQSVLVLYGSCAPYVGAGSLDGCGGSGPDGNQYSVLDRPVPLAPHIALQQSGKFAGAQQASSSSFTGQNFSVKAQYIDIDGVINAGSAASWTVQTTDALKDWIAATDQAYANGRISDPNIRLTVNANGGTSSLTDASGRPLLQLAGDQASQLIGAVYNAATHQLVLDNITANGGGSVTLDGKIVSTAQGSIHVNSGYGSIKVDNTAGVPLVLQNAYAGKGGTGIIAVTDRLQPWADGTDKTTWYVSENGQAAQQYDNRNGATDWQQAYQVGAIGDDATYAPKAGTEFQWAAKTYVRRSYEITSGDHPFTLGEWQWATESGDTTAGQHWTLDASKFIDGPGQSGYVDLAGNDYDLSLSGAIALAVVDVAYHGCHLKHCNYGTHQTGHDSHGDKASLWRYFYPTKGKLTLTATQRADLPIGIHFTTSGTNAVNIQSNSDILLNGQVNNSGGTTTLSATDGGSIVQGTDSALLWTHSLDMSAAGNIGSGHAPVQVRTTHQDSVEDGYLQARTNGGDIDIDVDSGSRALAFGAMAGDGADYGDVTIRNSGSLVGIDGAPVDVVGRDINLTSTQGSVGSIVDPLTIELHPGSLYNGAAAGGVLDVQASGDIGIDNRHGDLRVGQVASEHGDVALTASQGGIYDASGQDAASTLSQDQARAIWDKLHLTDGAAADGMVTAIESSVDASYAQYWQLRDVGTVTDGQYVLNADAVALYWPLAAAAQGIDPATVTDPAVRAQKTQAYASERYEGVVGTFKTYLGSDWAASSAFDGRTQANPAFHFVLDKNSAAYADLTSGSQWTDGQLKHAINGATLAAAGGSQVGPAVPNVSGANVTLNANAGGVGNNDVPLTIDYDQLKNLYEGKPSTLTDAQILALGQANAAGDVTLLDAAGNVLAVNDPDLQTRLATLSIRQTSPLYVAATGNVAGSATGSLYLQANGDLTIDRLQSGTDMRLTATGNIQAADTGDHDRTEIVTGGDLLLNAGGGHIAFGNGNETDAGDALVVDIGGALVGAGASTDLLIRQAEGDLRVGTAFGNGLVSLEASQGSLLGLTGGLSVSGHDVALAAHDDIGRRTATTSGVDAPLQVQMAATGHLDADAGGAVSLEVAQNDFHIGTIQSGGDLVLTADSGALDAQHLISTGGAVRVTAGTTGQVGDVRAADDVVLTAATALTAGTVASTDGDITLTAANGMSLQTLTATGGAIHATLVGTGSPALRIGAAGRLTAADAIDLHTGGDLLMGRGSLIQANGAVDLGAGGNIVLGRIDGLAATGTAIGLQAGGAILGNGDALNLQARAGGTTLLRATDGIGDLDRPLELDVDRLDAVSDQGDIRIHALGDLAVPQLLADSGTAQLSVDDLLQYDLLRAGLDATVSAGRIDGDVLTVGRQASIHADGNGTLHTLGIGGDLAMDTGGDLAAGTLTVAGQTALHAGGALDLTALDGGDAATLDSGKAMTLGDIVLGRGDLHADAGADLALSGHADVQQGNAALSSGTAMTLAALHAAGALDARAGGDFAADTLTVGGKTHLQAVGALDLTTLAGGDAATLRSGGAMRLGDVVLTSGDLQADAGNDLAVTGHADVQQGKAALTSQAAMTLAALHAATTFDAEASAGLSADELDVGGDAELSAGGTTHVQSATVGGDLTINADGDLAVETLAVGGKAALQADGWLGLTVLAGGDAATLKSGEAMTLGDIVLTDGDLQADAGADLALTGHAEVQHGDASFQAAGAMRLDGSLSSGGDVSMVANGPLQFTSIDAKGHVSGQSQTSDIGGNTVDADDWLKFLAGTDLRVGTLQAGGDTTLKAGNDIAIDKTTAGGDIVVTAGDDVAMTTTQAGKNGSIDAGGKLEVGQVQTAGTLNAEAGTDLTADTLAIGSASTIQAGRALKLTTLTGDGAATLHAGDAMTLGDIVLTAGDLQADAGADLALTGHAEVQRGGATLQAAGAMRLDGPLSSGGDVSMVANGPLEFTSIDAKGHVFGQSQTGDIGGNTVDADDWLKFLAGANLHVDTLQATGDTTLQAGDNVTVNGTTAGGDTVVTAGGDVAMTTTQAGKNAAIDAGGKLGIGRMQTGSLFDATAGTDLTAATLKIGGASTLHAGHVLQLTTLTGGGQAKLDAGDAMTLGDVVLTAGDLQADAGANLVLTGHADVQQGNAALTSKSSMSLAALHAAGTLDVGADADLSAGTLDVAGRTGLASGGTTRLQRATVGGDLSASAGADFTADMLAVAGKTAVRASHAMSLSTLTGGNTATLDSGDAMTLGDVVLTAGDLQADAGAGLLLRNHGEVRQGDAILKAAGTMRLDGPLSGGNVSMVAGGPLQFTSIDARGHAFGQSQQGDIAGSSVAADDWLQLLASANLRIDTLQAATDAKLQAGGNVGTNTLAAGGNVAVTGGGDVAMTTTQAGKNATIAAGRRLDIGRMQAGGVLDAKAATDLSAGTLQVSGTSLLHAGHALQLTTLTGGDQATLDSGDAMTLGDIVVTTGNLRADAGASLTLTGHADVQRGAATLTSAAAMTLAALHASGALNAQAATDLSASTLNVDDNADLAAQGAMRIKRATTGGNLAATAGHDLTADTLVIGGKTVLHADGKLDLSTLTGGDKATLGTGDAMTLGDVILTAGNLQADAGADLTLSGHADVQRGDTTLHAVRAMHLAGPLSSGGGVSMVAGGSLRFTSVDANGQVFGQSQKSDISGSSVNADDWLRFLAGTDIHVDTLHAATDATLQAGGDIGTNEATAGRDVAVTGGGDVAMTTTQAGRNVSIDAGGKLDVNGMQAGESLGLTAQRIRFDRLDASTSAQLLARKGDITGASLTTRDADMAAPGAIRLDAAAIGSSINLAADTITASVQQTRNEQSLHSVLTGFQGGTAQRITMNVDAPEQWMIDRLSAINAALATLAPSVRIKDGHSEQTMDLTTSLARLWMNQDSASLQPADVQLIQPGHDFLLYQDGVHTLSDAFVVRYAYGYEVDIPNYVATRDWQAPYYPGESALRFNGRTLVDHTDDLDSNNDADDSGKSKRARREPRDRALVQPAPGSGEIAVNLRAPN